MLCTRAYTHMYYLCTFSELVVSGGGGGGGEMASCCLIGGDGGINTLGVAYFNVNTFIAPSYSFIFPSAKSTPAFKFRTLSRL